MPSGCKQGRSNLTCIRIRLLPGCKLNLVRIYIRNYSPLRSSLPDSTRCTDKYMKAVKYEDRRADEFPRTVIYLLPSVSRFADTLSGYVIAVTAIVTVTRSIAVDAPGSFGAHVPAYATLAVIKKPLIPTKKRMRPPRKLTVQPGVQ